MKARLPHKLAAISAALLLMLTACTDSKGPIKPTDEQPNTGVVEESSDIADDGGRITYGLASESAGWNPTATAWNSSGIEVSRALFDTLTAFDENANPVPNVAKSITSNDTFTTWTITIRDQVTLHNGHIVDGAVVADNLELMRGSALFGPALEPIDTITTPDANSVSITTKRPWVALPHLLTTQIGIIADPNWLRSGDPSNPVGTGPFRFKSWDPGASLVVERNTQWWRKDPTGPQLPHLDAIEFVPIPDSNARAARLIAGRLDLMQTTTADHVTLFTLPDNKTGNPSTQSNYQVFTDAGGESTEAFVQLNTAIAPFDDLDARLALAKGTDPAAFVRDIERGQYKPASGPFAPNSPWYHDAGQPIYDHDGATAAADAVKAKHDGVFAFAITIPPETHLLDSARYLQEQWRKLGIDTQIEITPDRLSFENRVLSGNYQAILGFNFGAPDPFVDSVAWDASAIRPIDEPALNSARINDVDLTIALTQASANTDRARQAAFFAVVQERLAETVPFIWLFHGTNAVIASPNLVNVVNWTLPDGAKGLELDRGTHSLFQIWRTS